MGLFQKAVETYDNMKSLAGEESEKRKAVLALIGFNTTKDQTTIVITLTEEGDFSKAEKQKQALLIPVTEKSAGRTSTSAKLVPHPLCDKLMFICPENKESYDAYLRQLTDWCNSGFACAKIKAVLEYVKKGTVRADIASIDGAKDDNFVCWRVLSTDCSEPEEVWKSPSVIDSYTCYFQNKVSAALDKGLCYVSGDTTILMPPKQHLKGVVPSAGNAKLISANDTSYFTYRGRFTDGAEALTVGFLSSQKAHNALKWVVANEGVRYGDRLIVCWNPKGKQIQKPDCSLFPDSSETADKPTPTNYREKLAKIVSGRKEALEPTDETVIAVFDAATPKSGRLSVCYYSEMKAYDYLERLRYWDETVAWIHRKFGVTSPTLRSIVNAAYGVPRTNGEMQKIETDDKVLSGAMQRLLLCRLEKSPFPADIIHSAVQKCASLQLYKDEKGQKQREQQLFTTCAIIKKYRYDKFKEEWKMALEPEKKNRSYQFGRLLAVLEKAERDAFDQSEKREPNAMRLQTLYVKRPMHAAKMIIEQLKNAYYPRLNPGSRIYYDKLIGEIMLTISECPDGEVSKPLGEEYLLGYYLQKNALYTKKNNESEDEE